MIVAAILETTPKPGIEISETTPRPGIEILETTLKPGIETPETTLKPEIVILETTRAVTRETTPKAILEIEITIRDKPGIIPGIATVRVGTIDIMIGTARHRAAIHVIPPTVVTARIIRAIADITRIIAVDWA